MAKYGPCPECGASSTGTVRQRSIDGATICGGCGYKVSSMLWGPNVEEHESEQGVTNGDT